MDATYISATQFSVADDKTSEFVTDRRIKADCGGDGIKYATVVSSTYSSVTTVTIDESTLTSNLTDVKYGIVQPGPQGSLPIHSHDGSEGSGGAVTVSGMATCINSNMTLYISVSGSNDTGDGSYANPYATFDGPWNYLADKIINTNNEVTIQYLDGVHTVSGTLTPIHPNGAQITIAGTTVVDGSITSVQSSSGSTGNYSVVYNVSSVANIDVGDYIVVAYDASGGTNPSYACGCHEVTNVDTGNTRITVTSAHRKGSPSGAVSANFKCFKTVLSCSDGFIRLTNGATINAKDLVAKAPSSNDSDNGLYTDYNASITCTAPIGLSGFRYGVYGQEGGKVNFYSCGVSGCYVHCVATSNMGGIVFTYGVVSGSVTGSGVQAYETSSIAAYYAVSTGNDERGFYSAYNSFILARYVTATGNGNVGIRSNYNAGIRAENYTGGNNTFGDILAQEGGYVQT